MKLALDLGTTTGFAFRSSGGLIGSGTWHLKPGKGECAATRFERLRTRLQAFHDNAEKAEGIDAIYYEDVRRHAGNLAARVYNGLLAMLQVWCCQNNIPCIGVGVGQIKKFWTGNGRASKGEMIAEARRRGFDPIDDNEADALALLHRQIIQGDLEGELSCVTKTAKSISAPSGTTFPAPRRRRRATSPTPHFG